MTYSIDAAKKLTESFYLEVANSKQYNEALKSTVLGVIDTARAELEKDNVQMWATLIKLGESIWQRK